VRTGSLELRAAASLHALSRVGIVVPKYRHSAVDRNRLKRRLRELVRLHLLPALATLPHPLDVLIRAAPGAYQRPLDGLQRELGAVMRDLRRLAVAPTAPSGAGPAGSPPAVAPPDAPPRRET
jgi:ribonuclease P protein component